ncbi:MAG: RagB/SusD family nutrient uptake outer membrane protein [Bacteroidota bacterium]
MKRNSKILLVFFVSLSFYSCSLFDTLETTDPNNSGSENAVLTPQDAESVLSGAYAAMNQDGYYSRMQVIYGPILSGYMGSTNITTRNITFEAETNTVAVENNTVANTFDDVYELANRSTNVITLVGALEDRLFTDPTRKVEIIAEAHFLRGLAHFDALRFWGRFWDRSSDLGIPLRLEPGEVTNSDLPRSTVEEVYSSIMSDLDLAIAGAPDYSVSYFASKLSARAMKARVALYMEEYEMANQLADQVIGSTAVALEGSYDDIFTNRLNSSELIFAMFASQIEGSGHSLFILTPSSPFGQGRYDYAPTQAFLDAIDGDPRESVSINIAAEGPEVAKYPNLTIGDDPTYIMRLAEIYLIKAEALARGAGTVDQAREALNTIKNRAGTPPSTATDATQLLTEIQSEKLLELAFEGSHEWFDAIRFGNIQTIKPSVTSENFWVLPIPDIEDDPNGALDQNPGY